MSAFGDNQPGYALNWLQGGARRYMHLQPDRDYAWSCEQSYSRALRRAVPVCEEVDAVVYWGGAPNRVPMRRQYRRLLLPLRYNGRRHVMSVTCEDASIDLGSRANVLA